MDLSGRAEAMGLASRAAGRGGTSAKALATLFRVALLFFGLRDVQTQTVANTKPTYIWQTGMAVLSNHKSMLKILNVGCFFVCSVVLRDRLVIRNYADLMSESKIDCFSGWKYIHWRLVLIGAGIFHCALKVKTFYK